MSRMTLNVAHINGEPSGEELVDAAWLYAWSSAALRPAGSPTATRASRGATRASRGALTRARAYETLRTAISYGNRLTGHRLQTGGLRPAPLEHDSGL